MVRVSSAFEAKETGKRLGIRAGHSVLANENLSRILTGFSFDRLFVDPPLLLAN